MTRLLALPFFAVLVAVGAVVIGWLLWPPGNENGSGSPVRRPWTVIGAVAVVTMAVLAMTRGGRALFATRLLPPIGRSGWTLMALAIPAVLLILGAGNRAAASPELRQTLVRRGILTAGTGLGLGLVAHLLTRNPPVLLDYAVLALIGIGGLAALRASLAAAPDKGSNGANPKAPGSDRDRPDR
jgi:hypothetical protein